MSANPPGNPANNPPDPAAAAAALLVRERELASSAAPTRRHRLFIDRPLPTSSDRYIRPSDVPPGRNNYRIPRGDVEAQGEPHLLDLVSQQDNVYDAALQKNQIRDATSLKVFTSAVTYLELLVAALDEIAQRAAGASTEANDLKSVADTPSPSRTQVTENTAR
ncbi:hypothetical protein NFJ02_32g81470 [Pycnococcus provasolii]